MRIIKNGEPKELERKCQRCGCIFCFNVNDLDSFVGARLDGMSKRNYFVECPTCEYQINVSREEVNEIARVEYETND